MLIDTDVLIWYMRGNENARNILNRQKNFSISAITYMELVQGMRNNQELTLLRKALKSWNCKFIYLSEEISAKVMLYVEHHFLSHSMQLADALIGATATACALPLLTANVKHYKIIKEIELLKFTP